MPDQSKVFINGMGVLGRRIVRMILEHSSAYGNSDGLLNCVIVGINDANMSGDQIKYLLTYDTVYGPLKGHTVSYDSTTNSFTFDTHTANFTSSATISGMSNLNNATEVIDCIGNTQNATKEYMMQYLNFNAKNVLMCADHRGDAETETAIFGINDTRLSSNMQVIPSGLTTALAIMLMYLTDTVGVENAFAHIVTSYTNLNNLQDSAATYINRPTQAGRGGAVNIIPQSTTKAGKTVGLYVPQVNGHVSSYEASAGVNTGSTINLTVLLSNTLTREEWANYIINRATDPSSLEQAFLSHTPYISVHKDGDVIVTSDKIGDGDVSFTLAYDSFDNADARFINITSMFDAISVQAANALLTLQYLYTKG